MDTSNYSSAKMLLGTAAALALAILNPVSGLGQAAPTANYTSFEATSEKPVQIGYYATARKDCAPAPAPTIRIVQPPKAGTLTIRGGELTTSTVTGCAKLTTPAQIVFYQARAGATGADHFAYAVVGLNGKIDGYDVTITIRELPKAPVANQDKPI